jgi:hypothetical protein
MSSHATALTLVFFLIGKSPASGLFFNPLFIGKALVLWEFSGFVKAFMAGAWL